MTAPAASSPATATAKAAERVRSLVRVGLAGNPNAGKSSVFNAMTGARQHVGNYPGVTVERRSGTYSSEGTRYELVDLPGTYSLSSYSPEERITEHELLQGELDVVVLVADSSNVSRSLVLLAQLLQIGARPVLCLNMSDEARRAGQRLDVPGLEAKLGIPVVETVGHRGIGVEDLKSAVARAVAGPARAERLLLDERLDRALRPVEAKLAAAGVAPDARAWVATRLLLGKEPSDFELPPGCVEEAAAQREAIETETGLDVALLVAESYHAFAERSLRDVLSAPVRPDARAVSDRIDSVLAHRVWGLPIFALVMYGIFSLTFTLGEAPMGWIEQGFEALAAAVSGLWAGGQDSPLRSLLVDGVIGGVGGVIVFLPNILLLFLGLALLEDTGYMARAAFLMDRVLSRFGLHGRSFIPMVTGFGCSIPGIMATRTLDDERDRLTTMLVLPLMSCGARLPIYLLLVPAFFPSAWRAPMLWLIYAVGVGLALVLALVLRKSLLRGEEAPFVMELPPYRVPTLRAVVRKMTERGWLYLRKAGTIILAISIVMWAITSYPKPDRYEVDADIAAGALVVVEEPVAGDDRLVTEEEVERRRSAEDLRTSIAGRIGVAIEPVLAPLGFDHRLATAMLGAFAAKEVFVAQLGIVHSMGETDEESVPLREALQRDYTPLTGFCLMLFLLVATPCMATIAVTRRESGSWKWALLQLGGLTAVAYVLTLVVNQIGRLFG